jgi:hypothetical protein
MANEVAAGNLKQRAYRIVLVAFGVIFMLVLPLGYVWPSGGRCAGAGARGVCAVVFLADQ